MMVHPHSICSKFLMPLFANDVRNFASIHVSQFASIGEFERRVKVSSRFSGQALSAFRRAGLTSANGSDHTIRI